MKSVLTYLVGGGATGALVGGALFFLLAFTAVLSFTEWPEGLTGTASSTIDIDAPAQGGDAVDASAEDASAANVRLGGAPRDGGRGRRGGAADLPTGAGVPALGDGSSAASGTGVDGGGRGGSDGGGAGQAGSPGSGGGSPGTSAPGDSGAVPPGPATPPDQGGAPSGESAQATATPATAGKSGKVPPGQAKKYAESTSTAPPGTAPTAGNSGKVPPGQAKKDG